MVLEDSARGWPLHLIKNRLYHPKGLLITWNPIRFNSTSNFFSTDSAVLLSARSLERCAYGYTTIVFTCSLSDRTWTSLDAPSAIASMWSSSPLSTVQKQTRVSPKETLEALGWSASASLTALPVTSYSNWSAWINNISIILIHYLSILFYLLNFHFSIIRSFLVCLLYSL